MAYIRCNAASNAASKTLIYTGTKPCAGQTINVDLSRYSAIIVEYADNPTGIKNNAVYIEKGASNVHAVAGYSASGTTRGCQRDFTVTASSITFGDATFGNSDTDNQYLTPTIYAI